jgi:alkylhydroperoxidase/carboxymuconolactone decarboxylase family protein
MMAEEYYRRADLQRFGEVGTFSPELFGKFMDWYQTSLAPGALTKREKSLIGLAVAHVLQCPYCIDAFTQDCIREGMDGEHLSEAVHVASAVRGGASLIHSLQALDSAKKTLL